MNPRAIPTGIDAPGADRRRWTKYFAVSLAVLCGACPASGISQTMPDDQAVEAAAKALRGSADFPWYDRRQDALERIDVEPPSDLENRHSRWQTQPPNWNLPRWLIKLLEVLAWTLLVVLLAIVVYMMVRAFMMRETGAVVRSTVTKSLTRGDVDRVDSLPFQIETPRTSLLEEARRLYEAGRFGEAIVYLYSYQLVQLDKHQIIRLARGKTNRQYLREIRRHPDVRALLERTMRAFEDVFFGAHSLDKTRFESCWNRLDDFHLQLKQAIL